jgi:DNA-binding SARP family transcriptional activator
MYVCFTRHVLPPVWNSESGSLEVLDEGRRVALAGTKQRELLGLLVLHANQTVTTNRMIEELWDRPPREAAKAVYVYVSRLRKALGAPAANGAEGHSVILTRDRGYELRVESEALDLHRFERLAAEGMAELAADRPGRAEDVLERALSLWRGAPLADLADAPFVRREIARLDELRVGAVWRSPRALRTS